jgi:hypothetical protein
MDNKQNPPASASGTDTQLTGVSPRPYPAEQLAPAPFHRMTATLNPLATNNLTASEIIHRTRPGYPHAPPP